MTCIRAPVLFCCVFLAMSGLSHADRAALPWWKSPGSLASQDTGWRARQLQLSQNADSFAARLARNLRTGKGMAYLEEGGVSPAWYKPPIVVRPFPAPFSAGLYDLAFRAFVQTHHLQEAYRLAYGAVQQRPDSFLWRKRLIQVSLWLGQREEAMRQWQWLASKGVAGAMAKSLHLAAELSHPEIVVRLLSPLGRRGELGRTDWKTLIFAYGELGEPEKAVSDIDAALRQRKSRYLLEQKAYLSYQMGELQKSLLALESISRNFHPTPQIAKEEARLLSMQGKYGKAFAVMERVRPEATLEDVPFWQLYAVLAWKIHNNPAALDAEKKLYLLGAASEYDLQRLVVLAGLKNPQASLAVAQVGWKKYQLPLFYFEALYYAGQAREWGTMHRLLDSVPEKDPRDLKSFPAYWMAMGKWASAMRNYPAAGLAYAEALRLNPGDPGTENDLLWMLMDSGKQKTLAALLTGNSQHPVPAVAGAVRNALGFVGRTREALFVMAQEQAKKPDTRTMLDQSYLLGDAGDHGLAWTFRQKAIQKSLHSLQGITGHRGQP